MSKHLIFQQIMLLRILVFYKDGHNERSKN